MLALPAGGGGVGALGGSSTTAASAGAATVALNKQDVNHLSNTSSEALKQQIPRLLFPYSDTSNFLSGGSDAGHFSVCLMDDA